MESTRGMIIRILSNNDGSAVIEASDLEGVTTITAKDAETGKVIGTYHDMSGVGGLMVNVEEDQ